MNFTIKKLSLFNLVLLLAGCSTEPSYDLLLRNGHIFDGSGDPPYAGDVAINADTIAALGDLSQYAGKNEVDLKGMAVAPGFINMLSWANVSLIEDGRSQSDIRQGVTLEVLGEGSSMGPLNEEMKAEMLENQQDIKYDIPWTTLGEYLRFMEEKGVSPNLASFVGNGTLRRHVIGYDNREATEEELEQMKKLAETAMKEGAVGISSSLLYAPSGYASTEELTALSAVVGNMVECTFRTSAMKVMIS